MDREETIHLMGILRAFDEYEGRARGFSQQVQHELGLLPTHQAKALKDQELVYQQEVNSIHANQRFLSKIVDTAFQIFPELREEKWCGEGTSETTLQEHATKVRVTLSQFIRDWSSDGAPERAQCYEPVLKEIEEYFPAKDERCSRSILVPGCGLARLPWELASRGFDVNANEYTYFMLLAANFILHLPEGDQGDRRRGRPDCPSWRQFEIYPYVNSRREVFHQDDRSKKLLVPDVDTGTARMMMQAGDFLVEYSHPHCAGSYDCIATVFFLDTANNVLEYVQQIARLLKPGGLWVNLGPLLYHYSELNTFQNKTHMSLELTYEELKGTFAAFGLRLVKEKLQHKSRYNHVPSSMSTLLYDTVLFTCVKDPKLPVDAELLVPPKPPPG